MLIKLQNLVKGKEAELESYYDPEEENLNFDDYKYSGKIRFTASVVFDGNLLKIDGNLYFTVTITCSRCLEDYKRDLSDKIELLYNIEKNQTEVDIKRDILDFLIFEHKQRYLCSETCRGICPGCGVNLNNEECRCDIKEAVGKSGGGEFGELFKLKDLLNKEGEDN